jgi:hypothetical protein
MQYAFAGTCIALAKDGSLSFCGAANDPRAVAVENCEKARQADRVPSDWDLMMIGDLMVLREEELERGAALLIV